jgi:serine phosphatase RsbU (regulator of sigma subunit)
MVISGKILLLPLRKFFTRFRTKVMLLLAASILLVSVACGFFIYSYATDFQFDQLRKKLISVARLAASNVDPLVLSEVPLVKEGKESRQYKEIESALCAVKEIVPSIKYIYVLKKAPQAKGVLIFMVSIEAMDARDDTVSYPGDVYDASRFPEMLKGFEAATADKAFTTDAWGDFLSAYAPIKDRVGRPFAVLGVDMAADDVKKLQSGIRSRFIAALCGGLVLSVLLGVFISVGVSRQIRALRKGVERVSLGELDHKVEIKGSDEISELAGYFNKMAVDLKEHIEDLTRTTAEKERLLSELTIAKNIQQSLLPEFMPVIPGIKIAAVTMPARMVGGDFYDFISLGGGKWGIVIADVSGKGVPAALYMALSKAIVRSCATASDPPADALNHTNDNIVELSRSDMFVTLFYAVVDPVDMSFKYSNAGHNAPVFIDNSDRNMVFLTAQAMPLGISLGLDAHSETVKLKKGDVIVLYTDGVTEAENERSEQYNITRLQEVIAVSLDLSPEEISKKVQEDLTLFVGKQPQHDDITIMVIKAA